jgi:mRNA-degrading endonuclease RelE of RelBE toxin-antitoxin system
VLYNILTIPEFDSNVKRLSKRYPKIKDDLHTFIEALQSNPIMGTHLINHCYKVRLPNSSVPTGKSKGFRVITYHLDALNNIYLLAIYSKSDTDAISDAKIIELLKQIK